MLREIMMEQRANIEFCEIGENVHRNISLQKAYGDKTL